MEEEYELQSEQTTSRNLYFAGLAFFIAVSFALAVWAYIDLALAR